jgi:hypothetical protein
MTKKHPLQQIMEKPLSRKEFLQYIGMAIVAAFGVTAVLSNLLKSANHSSGRSGTGRKWGNGKFGV